MSEFNIKCHNGFIHIKFLEVFGFPDETCHWGGYDTKVFIEIMAGNLSAKSTFYLSTGNIFTFYNELKSCYESLNGEANFESYEKNLNFKMRFDITGKIEITGNFVEYNHSQNELIFELESDQSYLLQTLSELVQIVNQYGNLKGISNNS